MSYRLKTMKTKRPSEIELLFAPSRVMRLQIEALGQGLDVSGMRGRDRLAERRPFGEHCVPEIDHRTQVALRRLEIEAALSSMRGKVIL